MRKHVGMILLASLVVLALLTNTIAFQVDEFTDIVLVKRFGKVRAAYRGHDQAGLHFKWFWPVEKVVRYDARRFMLESPYAQVQTADEYNILASTFCDWRIATPQRFHQVLETTAEAHARIRNQLQSWTGNVIGGYRLQDLINTDPQKMRVEQLERQILTELKREVEEAYGVEIRTVGVKLWGFPEAVSSAVIDAQKANRQKAAQDHKDQGESRALTIRERAKSARDKILAFAQRKAAEIRAEGDRVAAEIYKEFGKNPELSAFLRSLESLKTELGANSTIVLDGSELPAVRWFSQGPSLESARPVRIDQRPKK